MREIKFRAMTKPPEDFAGYHFKSTMVYGTGIFQDGTNTWLLYHDSSKCLAEGFTKRIVKPETIGQFTGLPDKNGKEIYEGDIYDGENGIEEVWFEHGFFGTGKRHSNRSIGDYFGGIITYEDGHTLGVVIGNIHENPELLV